MFSKIISESWHLATKSVRLKWFAFVPAFVGVFIFTFEVLWQYFLLSEEFGIVEEGFLFKKIGETVNFISESGLLASSILGLSLVLLFAFVLPPLINATLILGVKQKSKDPTKKTSIRLLLSEASKSFFPLFEFKAILSPFKFETIIFALITLYRFFHGEIFSNIILPIGIFFLVLSFFTDFFFSFSPFFIVIEGEETWKSFRRSVALVFINLKRVFFLTIIMLFINLRVILNALIVFGIPAIFLGLTTYFSNNSGWSTFLLILAGLSAVGVVWVISYISALLEVFSTTFWERTFFHLRKEQDENRILPE